MLRPPTPPALTRGSSGSFTRVLQLMFIVYRLGVSSCPRNSPIHKVTCQMEFETRTREHTILLPGFAQISVSSPVTNDFKTAAPLYLSVFIPRAPRPPVWLYFSVSPFQAPDYLAICIICVVYVYLLQLDNQYHGGGDLSLFHSLLYPQHLKVHLPIIGTHSMFTE